MKPRVELKQRAQPEGDHNWQWHVAVPKLPCILLIDGIEFRSDYDSTGHTSVEINAAAERLVEEFKK